MGKNTDLERPEISASDKKNISEFWKNTHTHTDIQKKKENNFTQGIGAIIFFWLMNLVKFVFEIKIFRKNI